MPRPKKNKNSVPDTPSAQLLAEKPKTPKTNRTNLLGDSDSEDEFHSAQQSPAEAGFKINEEYARRFEHNKKREELHRCTCAYTRDGRETDDYRYSQWRINSALTQRNVDEKTTRIAKMNPPLLKMKTMSVF
jgi:hypothetical protein